MMEDFENILRLSNSDFKEVGLEIFKKFHPKKQLEYYKFYLNKCETSELSTRNLFSITKTFKIPSNNGIILVYLFINNINGKNIYALRYRVFNYFIYIGSKNKKSTKKHNRDYCEFYDKVYSLFFKWINKQTDKNFLKILNYFNKKITTTSKEV